MFSIEYQHTDGDDYVTKLIHTEVQTAEVYGHIAYRRLRVSTADGQLINDGTDTETVTINVMNGLDASRGDTPTVLSHDGELTVTVDGQQTTKPLTNGSVAFDLTTDKPAGSEIEVTAESLSTHPAKSDSASIEVISQ